MSHVIVSGGFDPLHAGHIRYMEIACFKVKELTKGRRPRLHILLNSDSWLERKKGYVFMPFKQRKYILERLNIEDAKFIQVRAVYDADGSVTAGIKELREEIGAHAMYFANGGDRHKANTPEIALCSELDIIPLFNCGTKIQSSSNLVEGACKRLSAIGDGTGRS